jgi:hypothetical protein
MGRLMVKYCAFYDQTLNFFLLKVEFCFKFNQKDITNELLEKYTKIYKNNKDLWYLGLKSKINANSADVLGCFREAIRVVKESVREME